MGGSTKNYTGEGRRGLVDFKYKAGFANHTRVEVAHTGRDERSGYCGYWMYLAPGSGAV